MAKKGQVSIYKEQRANKPAAGELVEQLLDGVLRDTMGDFIEYLKRSRMSPSWYATNAFNVNFKGKRVMRINIGKGDQRLRNHVQIFVYPSAEDGFEELLSNCQPLRDRFIANISYCRRCGSCAPGRSISLLGKTYENVCNFYCLDFYNPTKEEMETIKALMSLRRSFIEAKIAGE